MVEILSTITQKRARKIADKGYDLGHKIPKTRSFPLIKPRFDDDFFIAEIKRASPTNAHIGDISSPVNLARDYLNGGANALSILCEEEHFKGSLEDLMAVKAAFPNACILRKDFIQYPQEIATSFRAGADMVLLIVAMFIDENEGFKNLKEIYEECLKYGITPLIEVHNAREIDFIAPLKPEIVGINSRHLATFEIDIIRACLLREKLPQTKVLFESGITSNHLSFVIGSFNFDGLLCGSYLIAHSNPTNALQELKNAFKIGKQKSPRFYQRVFEIFTKKPPLLKVCGIKDIDNALMVGEFDIDAIGFIMIEKSPRFVDYKSIVNISKALSKICPHILRIGVIDENPATLQKARELLQLGHLDALQLHSITNPRIFAKSDLSNALFCFYVVQNIAKIDDFMSDFEGVFCLLDSKSGLGGGSGKSIEMAILNDLNLSYLCVAGGIGAENVKEILALKPQMIDVNSCIESAPAKKDKNKLLALLKALNRG